MNKKSEMYKRPFITFILVIGILVSGLLWFIQSSYFAQILKTVASRYVPKNQGIEADFSELSIKFFPPGLSIRNPKIVLGERNVVGLPPGSSIVAERVDLSFLPFQVLSGDIRIHQVTVINGNIQLILDSSVQKKKRATKPTKLDFHWDELLQIRAESLALQNVELKLMLKQTSQSIELKANTLRLAQWSGRGGLGYQIDLDLSQARGDLLKTFSLPEPIDRVQGRAYVNALGLNLESLSFSHKGVQLSASGQVRGNLLDPKNLMADGTVKLDGDCGRFLSLYPKPFGSGKALNNDLQGTLSFVGKVQGNLRDALNTLRASGTLTIHHLAFQKWNADTVQAEVRWEASPSGGEVSLVKAYISTREQARVGGHQPGSGGKIEIGPSKWQVGSSDPIKVPIHFERAHSHWLGAGAIKDVYPLDFRLNGTIAADLTIGKKNQPWEVQAVLDTWIQDFQLDNQRYLQTKPLNRVFKVPKIGLDGAVVINSAGVYFVNVMISLPHTKFRTNGKIDFKTGLDFHSIGPVDLEDLGQIAENNIRGQGNLNIHVHGLPARVFVDIDADLKDTFYLNLSLGDMKGKLTWDDDPQALVFDQTNFTQFSSQFAANGVVDVGKKDTVDLKVDIKQGNIQDFIHIFRNLTRPISWFPSSLKGALTGTVNVTGGLRLSLLKVIANVKGSNWEYWGERFQNVTLVGGYDSGKYEISEFSASKRAGSLSGRIFADERQKIQWDFETRNFSVIDFDHIAQLDVPFRGKLDIQSSGQGQMGSMVSSTEIHLTDFSVRGLPLASSVLTLRTQGGAAYLQGSAMGGQGILDAKYDFNPRELSHIHAEFKQLDFSPVLLLLNPKSIQDRALSGYLTGSLNLNFHSGQMDRASGSFAIAEYLLAGSNNRVRLSNPVSVKITDGSFEVENLVLQGRLGMVALNLQSRKSQIEGSLQGDLDTSLIEFFTSSVVRASGTTNLNLAIGGTLKSPTLFGRASMEGNSVRIASLESPLENVTGSFQLKQNAIVVQNFQTDLGGGRILVDGRIVINADRYPEIFLNGKLNGPKIKMYPFQYLKVKGMIRIHGEDLPYLIDGDVVVESALSKEKVLNRKQQGAGLKAFQYAPLAREQGEGGASKFKLNIQVEANGGVQIQNDLFRDVQAKGKMTLVNTLDAPRIMGVAEVTQGKILFKDHVFQIQNASANFDSPTVINPSLDLSANSEVNGVKIRMYATGRPDKIKIEFSSNPAMQEAEILSLLTVGLTSSDAKKLNAADLSAVQQGEAASLVLHSLDFNRDLEDKTGFQVQVDESLNPQQGISAFRPQSQVDTAAAPQITIRRKLGERVSLSAGSTLGVGTNKSNQVNLDYSVNQDLSITGVFNSYGTYGTAVLENTTNSLGLDLKFQKRFK